MHEAPCIHNGAPLTAKYGHGEKSFGKNAELDLVNLQANQSDADNHLS
jgi:hypothetical protein